MVTAKKPHRCCHLPSKIEHTDQHRLFRILYNRSGDCLPPQKNCFFSWGDSSPANKKPYRCCHLPNKIENIDRMPDIPYTLQCARGLSPQNGLFLWGDARPRLIHGFLGQPESIAPAASKSVHPFSHTLRPTDRSTDRHRHIDHATSASATIGRILCFA